MFDRANRGEWPSGGVQMVDATAYCTIHCTQVAPYEHIERKNFAMPCRAPTLSARLTLLAAFVVFRQIAFSLRFPPLISVPLSPSLPLSLSPLSLRSLAIVVTIERTEKRKSV